MASVVVVPTSCTPGAFQCPPGYVCGETQRCISVGDAGVVRTAAIAGVVAGGVATASTTHTIIAAVAIVAFIALIVAMICVATRGNPDDTTAPWYWRLNPATWNTPYGIGAPVRGDPT